MGMLAHLLANGELGKGSSLFWDTPEATLNPSTLRKLVHTLVALSRLMQITIATHSIFLLRELEILQERQLVQDVHYLGLSFCNGVTEVRQGDNASDIGTITALDAELEQSEEYLSL